MQLASQLLGVKRVQASTSSAVVAEVASEGKEKEGTYVDEEEDEENSTAVKN